MSVNEQSAAPQDIIVVPTSLPMILKQFCKAAIRTQPYDLLKWSSSYFRALADGEEPPTKLRLEYPPPCSPSGLTLGFLRVLLRQFGGTKPTSTHCFNLDIHKRAALYSDIDYNKLLPVETIFQRWDCLCLDRKELCLIMSIGRFRRKCQVKKFLAIAVGLLGTSLFDTMVMICELFTHDPEGSAMVPVTLFMEIYGYLAGLRCDGSEKLPPDEGESMSGNLSANGGCGGGPRQSVSESNQSLGLVHSMTSQDTDADINLDLELVSKEDPESARSHSGTVGPTEQTTKPQPNKNRNAEVSSPSSHGTLKAEGGKTSSQQEDTPQGRRPGNSQEERSSKEENNSSRNTKSSDSKVVSQRTTSNGDRVSSAGRQRGKSETGRRKHYPNIPGIGPRLSAEQVANVAIWLSECARLQGGMVGSRNLRHIDCPPLDKEDLSNS